MHVLDYLPSVIGAAAVVPALLLLWLIVAADQRPEPPGIVLTAFLLGAASIFLLRYLRMPLAPLIGVSDGSWIGLLRRALFSIAVPEETAKILMIGLVSLRRRAFEDPMDTVVYGAAVGLGFAAYENLGYLARHADDWHTLAFVRSVLTVPFHAALGVIAGAYLTLARFGSALGAQRHGLLGRGGLIAAIWLVPVALHAAFDLPLLALRNHYVDGALGLAALQGSGLLVGFGSIALAARLIWRIDAHHHPLIGKTRPPAVAWRAVWAMLTIGGAAAFVGAAVVASQLQHGAGDDSGVSVMVLVFGLMFIIFGGGIFWWGRRALLHCTNVAS